MRKIQMAALDRSFVSSILSIKHFKGWITTTAFADGSHFKTGKHTNCSNWISIYMFPYENKVWVLIDFFFRKYLHIPIF